MNGHHSPLVSPCLPPIGVARLDDAPVEKPSADLNAQCRLTYAEIGRIVLVSAACSFGAGVILTTIIALLGSGGPR